MAREEQQRRQRKVVVLWGTVALVLAVALTLALRPDAVEADFTTVDRGTVSVDLVDEGRTRMHDIYTVAAPVSARVLRIDAEPGDSVAAGAVVAHMADAAAGFLDRRNDLQARAAVEAAGAQLAVRQADLALARSDNERNEMLLEQHLIAAAVVDASRARLQASLAARDAAQAELARARSALLPPGQTGEESLLVRSPVAGRVLRVIQKSEAVLPAGSPLVDIGDPSHIEVAGEFLSQEAVRMKPGQHALIENWGGPALAATVERVEPVAHTKVSALGVEEQRTYVILQFDDPAQAQSLGHDYRVDVRVIIEQVPDALRVPLGALFRRGAQWYVFRAVDGHASLAPVEVGAADGTWRVITAGLAEGERVVVFPGDGIHDGAKLKARAGGP